MKNAIIIKMFVIRPNTIIIAYKMVNNIVTDVGKRLNSLFKDENLIIISNHFQKVLNTITNYLPLSI